MAKLYSTLKKGHTCIKSIWATLVAVLIFPTIVCAQGSGTKNDPYILEDGKTYAMKAYKDFYAQFIVPEDVTSDGVVLEIVANDIIQIFADAEFEQLVSETSGNFAPYTSSVKIKNGTKKGTTYYVYCDFPMNGGDVTVSYGGGTPTALAKVSPEQNSELHAAYGLITFEFTKNIRFKQCALIAGGTEQMIDAFANGKFVTVHIKDELVALYKKKSLKAGDKVIVELREVTSEDGKTQLGNITAEYTAAAQPLMLNSATQTPGNGLDALLSWMSPNKSEGLVALTFNGKVNRNANITAELSFGDLEAEDPNEYYVEKLPVTFAADNSIQIDLRGKVRTPQTMVASGTNYGSILLTIKGVEDEHGNKTYVEGSGAAGAYFFNYDFVVVDYSLLVEFTPSKGSCIDGLQHLEVWMQETGGEMEYSGATFEYTNRGEKQTVVVDAKDFMTEVDPEDEAAVYVRIPVPSFSRDANTEVKVSFNNVVAPNGMDYTTDLTATYTTKGYTETAIYTAQTTSGNVTVFTLCGVKILDNAPYDAIKSLKRGMLYIVNGKKWLAR
ncbi:MAG: hypothetical protein J6R79_05480 [Bacteroidaceae bacterium]|nr:hypothetical protein [Bacteroidaceae bacterium]